MMTKAAIFQDFTATFAGGNSKLTGIIKKPVILASEMLQEYHVSEIPSWVTDKLPKWFFKLPYELQMVPILKPYEEIVKMIKGVDKLPFTMGHHGIVESDGGEHSIGYVKDIKPDPKKRCVKGYAYIYVDKISKADLELILSDAVIAVSIGGVTRFGKGGVFGDEQYLLKQENIKLNHLALLINAEGRCPAGVCGLNMYDAYVKAVESVNFNKKMCSIIGECSRFEQNIFDIDNTLLTQMYITHKALIEDINKSDITMDKELEILLEDIKSKIEKKQSINPDSISAINDQIAKLNDEEADLKKKLAECNAKLKGKTKEGDVKDAKIKEFEDEKKEKLSNILIASKKYTEKELADKSLDSLTELVDSYKRFHNISDSADGVGFKKPNKKEPPVNSGLPSSIADMKRVRKDSLKGDEE